MTGELRPTFPVPQSPLTHQFLVTATDGGQQPKTATATVTVNVDSRDCTAQSNRPQLPVTNNGKQLVLGPLCPDPMVMQVEENRAGVVLGSVQARDASPGGVLQYTLSPTGDARFFQVDTVAKYVAYYLLSIH